MTAQMHLFYKHVVLLCFQSMVTGPLGQHGETAVCLAKMELNRETGHVCNPCTAAMTVLAMTLRFKIASLCGVQVLYTRFLVL